MKKIVTITIEVDMNTKECREWVRPSDYVKYSVFECGHAVTDTVFEDLVCVDAQIKLQL